jgi:hypothetical protein
MQARSPSWEAHTHWDYKEIPALYLNPWLNIVFQQLITELCLDSDKSIPRLIPNHSEPLHDYFPVCFYVDQVKPNSTNLSTMIIQDVNLDVLSAVVVKFPVFDL